MCAGRRFRADRRVRRADRSGGQRARDRAGRGGSGARAFAGDPRHRADLSIGGGLLRSAAERTSMRLTACLRELASRQSGSTAPRRSSRFAFRSVTAASSARTWPTVARVRRPHRGRGRRAARRRHLPRVHARVRARASRTWASVDPRIAGAAPRRRPRARAGGLGRHRRRSDRHLSVGDARRLAAHRPDARQAVRPVALRAVPAEGRAMPCSSTRSTREEFDRAGRPSRAASDARVSA